MGDYTQSKNKKNKTKKKPSHVHEMTTSKSFQNKSAGLQEAGWTFFSEHTGLIYQKS